MTPACRYRAPVGTTTPDHETVSEHIAAARAAGIELTPDDFEVVDGEPTLDGMRPSEWLAAMTME